jgi:erythromycin esterase
MTSAPFNDWLTRDALPFALEADETFAGAVDRLVASLSAAVSLLGFGEALHGSEDLLLLRNRLFERLTLVHGYSAIALESSFPRGRILNDYVCGRGPPTYEEVQETGFSHGFGRLAANRELVEWLRRYNADPATRRQLHIYGFDSPTEMTHGESPRQLLSFVFAYFASVDPAAAEARRQRVEHLLSKDAAWDNPAAAFEPSKSIGLSPAAVALRIEVEDLIIDLQCRRPQLMPQSDEERYLAALHDACQVRQLLCYHATLARKSDNRLAELLGIRDVMMADNLAYIVARERTRGKVLAFAHNTHLQRSQAQWQLGPNSLQWWPAGAHLHAMLGPRYAVIASGLGACETNGIGPPEAGTLEALLTAAPGPARFIPTHRGRGLPPAALAALPTRSGSATNQSYFALTPRSLTDFDWLVVLDKTTRC